MKYDQTEEDPSNSNVKHKWQEKISNRFDKLVALVTQNKFETPKQQGESNIKKSPNNNKNNKQNQSTERLKEFINNRVQQKGKTNRKKNDKKEAKKHEDTPPRTPSPSISIERPKTPQTPASPSILFNVQHDKSSVPSPASTSSKASSVDSTKHKNNKSRSKSSSSSSTSSLNNHIAKSTANFIPVTQSISSNFHNDPLNFDWNHVNKLNEKCSNYNQQSLQFSTVKNSINLESVLPSYINSTGTIKNFTNNHMKIPQKYPSQIQFNNDSYNTASMIPNYSLDQRINNNYNSHGSNTSVIHSNSKKFTQNCDNSFGTQLFSSTHYLSQNSSNQYHQQQKLLRPSRLDAVIKKDFMTESESGNSIIQVFKY